jgi:hypothetical protein
VDEPLFDASEYQVKKSRKPRVRVREQAVRLVRPWVLLRQHNQPPAAHLVMTLEQVDHKIRAQVQGASAKSAIPRCRPKKMFMVLEMDGAPLAAVCADCLEYARKNLIPVEVVER